MAYKVALAKNFLKELKKLPQDVRDRILRVIDEVIVNPFDPSNPVKDLDAKRLGEFKSSIATRAAELLGGRKLFKKRMTCHTYHTVLRFASSVETIIRSGK